MKNKALTPEEIIEGLEKIKKHMMTHSSALWERKTVCGAIRLINRTLPRYTCFQPPTEEDCIRCECGCGKFQVLAWSSDTNVFDAQDLDMVLMNPTLFPLWIPMPRAPRCGD